MTKSISFFKASLRLWRRHIVGVLIATFGLACAFAVGLLAAFYVYDGVRSDYWIKDVDTLYRLNNQWLMNGQKGIFGIMGRSEAAHAALVTDNVPEIQASVRLYLKKTTASPRGETDFDVNAIFTDPSIADLIPLPMVSGDLVSALATPDSLVLMESEAKRLFGGDAMGQTLTLTFGGESFSYKVAGVAKDIPPNSQFDLKILLPWNDTRIAKGDPYWEYSVNVFTYLRLAEGTDIDALNKRMRTDISALSPPRGNMSSELSLEPVKGSRVNSRTIGALKDNLDTGMMNILMLMASVLLAAAGFNFVHLTTGIALMRSREVAIRRISGASRGHLMASFLVEACLLTLIAYGMSILMAADLAPFASSFIGTDIPVLIPDRIPLLAIGSLGALLVGWIAALYMVGRISRITPQTLLHSTQAAVTGSGARLKSVLLAVQALALVGSLLAGAQIYHQFQHMLSIERGIKTDGVLIIRDLQDEPLRALFNGSFFEDVKNLPGVKNAALLGTEPFSRSSRITSYRAEGAEAPEQSIVKNVGPDYFDFLGAKVLASAGDWHDQHSVIALPESSLNRFGFKSPEDALNKNLMQEHEDADGNQGEAPRRIMAVVADIKDHGHQFRQPVVYDLSPTYAEDQASIMLVTDSNDVALEKTVRQMVSDRFPGVRDPKIEWLTDSIRAFYAKAETLTEVVAVMAGLCLVLCIAALYSLASHYATTRAREIALRRVLGAGKRDISRLFLKKMLLPVAVGGGLAIVPIWWLMAEWMTKFKDQATLPYPIYAAVLIGVLALSSLMLMGHVRRILKLRPARVLYHE